MFKRILFVLLAAVAVFVGYVALKPAEIKVSRATVIDAPPAKVFMHVNDLKKWDNWSPWAKRDPNAKSEHSGAPSGKGAVFTWSGNDEVGEGKMTIVDSQPPKTIQLSLDFVAPHPGTADVWFAFQPEGEKTRVTWSLVSPNEFVKRAILTAMMIDVAEMIGADYDKGLAALKKVVEAEGR